MNDFIQSLVDEFDDPDRFIGVLLVGSAARGDDTVHSDTDLVFYTTAEPADEHDRYRLTYRQGRLVSISTKTLDDARFAFEDPLAAIATIQGLRDAIILREPEGKELSELKKDAELFEWWSELRAKADREASYQMMGNAEEVHKILKGLSQNDNPTLLNGAWGLALAMPLVIALKHRILSRGDNLFRKQVCKAVGIRSNWTHYHAIASGESPGPLELSHLAQQAVGACWLYEETAQITADILLPEDRKVVLTAIKTARKSGLIPRI